jgi:hypothetical protein
MVTVAIAVCTVLVVGVVVTALIGRQPHADPIDLAFPLNNGTYLVVNGGSHLLINAHLNTLKGDRFRAYRGQSFGVDLVRINRVGLRAPGWLPADPTVYVIFGDPVFAPCPGRVVVASDGAPDMPPPQPDRSHMAGNHVMLDCAGTWVLLGHLQRGTVAVHMGQIVKTGDYLGRVGNSGNTSEPHLHVHAQRPGTDAEPLSGDPVPIRLAGRYLARNDHVSVTSPRPFSRKATSRLSSTCTPSRPATSSGPRLESVVTSTRTSTSPSTCR